MRVFAPLVFGAVVIAAAVTLTAARPAKAPTPTHITAVFVDGVNHGDFRQTCSVWRAGRQDATACAGYLAMMAAMGGMGGYAVVPHSYRGWTETHCTKWELIPTPIEEGPSVMRGGCLRRTTTEVATVQITYLPTGGKPLTARLVKTKTHGWLIVKVS